MKKSLAFILSVTMLLFPVNGLAQSQAEVHRENAKNSKEAADANRETGYTQAAASAVCFAQCASEKLTFGSGFFTGCTIASAGASLHDYMKTKELMSLATTAAGALGRNWVNDKFSGGGAEAALGARPLPRRRRADPVARSNRLRGGCRRVHG